MAKNLFKGMAALCFCAAFASCSKDIAFDVDYANQQADASYDEAFVKQFGPISPTQNWDFTKASATTRAGETYPIQQFPPFGNDHYGTGGFNWIWESGDASRGVLNNAGLTTLCKQAHKSKIEDFSGIGFSDWNPDKYKYVYFRVHSMTGDDKGNEYKQIGVYLPGNGNYWLVQGNPSAGFWSNGSNYMARPRGIDFTLLPEGTKWFMISHSSATEAINASDYELKQFKEKTYTIGSDVYTFWGFDTTGNGQIDLVLWVDAEEKTVERVVQKRYMAEDLGGDNDTDFNDVVFDIVQNSDGQTGYVRALGGTLDIAILVNGVQCWRKSLDENYPVKTMFNTGYQGDVIDYHKSLAEFNVTGWDENDNNVSIVVYQDGSSQVATKLIKFPIVGSIPRMVAVDVKKYWQKEKTRITSLDWFTTLDE